MIITFVLLAVSMIFNTALLKSNYEIKQTAAYKTNSELVYVTPSGKSYHKKGCRTIKKSTNVIPIEHDIAVKSYKPCSVCKPKQ